MKTIPFKCPKCGQPNPLTALLIKGAKRRLGLVCGERGKLGKTDFVYLPRTILDALDENDPDFDDIPTYYTPAARSELKAKANYGLPLMNVQPGQAVERSVELTKAVESDADAATLLLAEIAQIEQAQKELTSQIEALARKRVALERAEIDGRSKLREVYTEPLNLQ